MFCILFIARIDGNVLLRQNNDNDDHLVSVTRGVSKTCKFKP